MKLLNFPLFWDPSRSLIVLNPWNRYFLTFWEYHELILLISSCLSSIFFWLCFSIEKFIREEMKVLINIFSSFDTYWFLLLLLLKMRPSNQLVRSLKSHLNHVVVLNKKYWYLYKIYRLRLKAKINMCRVWCVFLDVLVEIVSEILIYFKRSCRFFEFLISNFDSFKFWKIKNFLKIKNVRYLRKNVKVF